MDVSHSSDSVCTVISWEARCLCWSVQEGNKKVTEPPFLCMLYISLHTIVALQHHESLFGNDCKLLSDNGHWLCWLPFMHTCLQYAQCLSGHYYLHMYRWDIPDSLNTDRYHVMRSLCAQVGGWEPTPSKIGLLTCKDLQTDSKCKQHSLFQSLLSRPYQQKCR